MSKIDAYRCDHCGAEQQRTTDREAPINWEAFGKRHLCETCIPEYRKLVARHDAERAAFMGCVPVGLAPPVQPKDT